MQSSGKPAILLFPMFAEPLDETLTMRLRCAILAGALVLTSPAAMAQRTGGDEFKGHGAAHCIAAGEFLSRERGADSRIHDDVLAWRQVLHVVEGTDAERRAAVDSARAGMARVEEFQATVALTAARTVWSGACAEREMQVRYIAVHGSEDRARDNLADEPGGALGEGAAQRLNTSASCLVGAELFSQRRPSRQLQAAFRQASPPTPDADVLGAIEERSRREIDAAPGSAIGRELVVDYLRYLYRTAAGGRDPQRFVDRISENFASSCQASAEGSQPAS